MTFYTTILGLQDGGMVGLRGTRVVAVPLAEATAGPRTVELSQFAEAEVFFG